MTNQRGMLYAAGAYVAWGLLPIFWKALQHVPALQLLAHRVVWSLVVTLLLVSSLRQWPGLLSAMRNPRIVLLCLLSGGLLGVNWLVYIWAVQAGLVLDASLGYFINPLVNILLGILFLHERLRPGQAIAVLLALAGVVYLTLALGTLPWVALVLAGTFGAYGLLRKTAALGSLEGLSLETLLFTPLALIYLGSLGWQGQGTFGHSDLTTTLLLIASGAITTLPLVLFAAGARRLPLILLGILQYISPTLQFVLGVWLYGETLSQARLLGFCLIWLALAVYTLEGSQRWFRQRHRAGSVAGG